MLVFIFFWGVLYTAQYAIHAIFHMGTLANSLLVVNMLGRSLIFHYMEISYSSKQFLKNVTQTFYQQLKIVHEQIVKLCGFCGFTVYYIVIVE